MHHIPNIGIIFELSIGSGRGEEESHSNLVVASTKSMKATMSLTISLTMRRRTHVLLKREKIWKAFTLWAKLSRVRSSVLLLVSVDDKPYCHAEVGEGEDEAEDVEVVPEV